MVVIALMLQTGVNCKRKKTYVHIERKKAHSIIRTPVRCEYIYNSNNSLKSTFNNFNNINSNNKGKLKWHFLAKCPIVLFYLLVRTKIL